MDTFSIARVGLLLGFCAFVGLASACMRASKAGSSQVSTSDGHALYNRFCVSCHGFDGAGDGPGSAVTQPKPRDFTSTNWQEGASDERIRTVIAEGGRAVGISAYMPPWKQVLSRKQIDALVVKVRSFCSTEGERRIVTQPGAPTRHLNAAGIFSNFCFGCHGGGGRGDGYAVEEIGKAPPDFTSVDWQKSIDDREIEMTIRLGGLATGRSSCMPAWGGSFDREMAGLVEYIRHLGEASSPDQGRLNP